MGSRTHQYVGEPQPSPHCSHPQVFEEARKNLKAKGASKGKKTTRLYCKAVVMGYKRALRSQSTHTNLLKIQGVDDTASTDFYLGKKVLYCTVPRQKRMTLSCVPSGGRLHALMEQAALSVPSSHPTCHQPQSA